MKKKTLEQEPKEGGMLRNAKPNCASDPKGYGYRTPPPSAPAPAAAEQRHAPANSTMKLFFCARTTRTTPTRPPQPFNSSSRRTTPTRPSDRNAPKLPPSLQIVSPACFERFWEEISQLPPPPDMDAILVIAKKYQLEIHAP